MKPHEQTWRKSLGVGVGGVPVVVNSDGWVVAHVSDSDTLALIAAAPPMARALMAVSTFTDDRANYDEHGHLRISAIARVQRTVDAALKAAGVLHD